MTLFLVVAYHSSPFFLSQASWTLSKIFAQVSLPLWNQIILLYHPLITSLQGRPKPSMWHSISGTSCLCCFIGIFQSHKKTPADAKFLIRFKNFISFIVLVAAWKFVIFLLLLWILSLSNLKSLCQDATVCYVGGNWEAEPTHFAILAS